MDSKLFFLLKLLKRNKKIWIIKIGPWNHYGKPNQTPNLSRPYWDIRSSKVRRAENYGKWKMRRMNKPTDYIRNFTSPIQEEKKLSVYFRTPVNDANEARALCVLSACFASFSNISILILLGLFYLEIKSNADHYAHLDMLMLIRFPSRAQLPLPVPNLLVPNPLRSEPTRFIFLSN